MTEIRTGDIVRHQSPHDGFVRIGIVRRVAVRAEGLLAEICAHGAGFGTVVELIERPSDHAVIAKPNGRVPMLGEMVTYETHQGAGRHTGSVFGVLLLRDGTALVRIGRSDAPLSKVIEFIEALND